MLCVAGAAWAQTVTWTASEADVTTLKTNPFYITVGTGANSFSIYGCRASSNQSNSWNSDNNGIQTTDNSIAKSGIAVYVPSTSNPISAIKVTMLTTDSRKVYYTSGTSLPSANPSTSVTLTTSAAEYEPWGTSGFSKETYYSVGGQNGGSGAVIFTKIEVTFATAYAITWNNGGHGTAPTSPTSDYNFTLPTMDTADGYINTGWTANQAVEVNGNSVSAGTEIAVGTSVTLTAATTFTGVWEKAVDEAPNVTAETSSTDVRAGGEVTLTATPTGYPVPTLQWYSCDSEGSNQSVIDGATNTTYQPSTSTLGAGTFYFLVKASNSIQSDVASDVVSVKVYDAGASGAVSDLVAVPNGYIFVADDITINGTSSPTASTLYDGSKVFVSSKFSVSTSAGSNTFGGSSHLNSMRLKNSTDYIAFKVSAKCNVTFYGNSYSTRDFKVGTSANDDSYGTFSGDNKSQDFTIPSAGTVYITGSGSDRYLAGFVVTYTNAPSIATQPKGANYDLNATATAMTIVAEPYTEGKALSYQWYSNTTNSTEGATAIEGATSTSYTPSTATGGTTYYYCVVSEEDNDETTTSDIVAVKVIDLGELIVTLQPATAPGNDTTIPNFSKNGFTTTGLTTISSWTGFTQNFKIKGTVTITAPSNATINSLKIYGYCNNESNTTTVTAGTGSSISGNATLQARNSDGNLSEVLLVVDPPVAGNTVSFSIGDQSRIMIEVYGSATYADQSVTATKLYSTFCSAYDLDFSDVENLEAYTVSAINTNSATLTKVNTAPAGTGLILKKTANVGTASEFSIPVIASAAAVGTNFMVGVLAETDMTSVANAYILSDGKFYECSGGNLAAGKAYLKASAWGSSNVRSFSLVFEDVTTGIKNVSDNIKANGEYYDLQGRRVAQPTKGLYILNGKKVVMK